MIYILLIPMLAFLFLWLKARDDTIWLKRHYLLVAKTSAIKFVKAVSEGDADDIVEFQQSLLGELE